jgi:hypothetical protein
MSTWTTKAHELRIAQAQQVAAILRDLDPNDTRTFDDAKTYIATAGGDEQKLRGIPAIGRGVQGAVPGSNPGANLWR